MNLYQQLPPDMLKIILVLFLSFLIGLEREEHKVSVGSYSFGGVRTFPLIGLIGYSLALLSGTQLLPLTVGFLVVPGGRTCLFRASVDCHYSQRSQPAVT